MKIRLIVGVLCLVSICLASVAFIILSNSDSEEHSITDRRGRFSMRITIHEFPCHAKKHNSRPYDFAV